MTGEQRYLDIAQAYWKSAVTDRGSYVTGGQTCGEIWSAPNQLKARLGDKNQEHCTVYNMMRLADFLFRHTQDPVYLDYWEKNLYNGIIGTGILAGQLYTWKKIRVSDKRTADVFPSAARRCTEGMGIKNTGFLLLSWIACTGECSA